MESSDEKNTEQKGNTASAESSQSSQSSQSSSEEDNKEGRRKPRRNAEEKFQRLAAAAGLDEEAVARLRAIGLDDEQLEAVLAVCRRTFTSACLCVG